MPPGNGAASDEDSADEDESKASTDNLAGRQLTAEADATVHRSYSLRERLIDEENLSNTDVDEPGNTSEDK